MDGAPAEGEARAVSSREVLRDREFRGIFLAGGLSSIGDQLARIAIALLVFDRTGSAFAASATYACSYLTWLLGGPLLSVLADRCRRRRLMIGTDLARLALVGLLAVPAVPLWVVFPVLVLVGLLSPPFESARSALLADVLTGEAYLRGNTLSQTVSQTAQVVGFVSGGALVAVLGVHGTLLVNAVSFGVSALLLAVMVVERPGPERSGEATSLFAETATGGRLVWGSPRLRRLLAWALLSSAVAIGPEGLAVSVADELDGGPLAAGVLTASVPLGFLLGAFGLGRLAPARREALFAPLTLLTAVPLMLTPLLGSLWAVASAWTLAGLGTALQIIANTSFVQAVPSEARGRAFGLAVSALMAVQGFVLLLAGAVAEPLGSRAAVALLALVGLVAMPLAAMSGRDRRAGGGGGDRGGTGADERRRRLLAGLPVPRSEASSSRRTGRVRTS